MTGFIDDLWQQAHASFVANDLATAEKLAREILQQNPKHAAAMQLLGLIARAAGRSDVAAELVRRAVAMEPNNAEFRTNFGSILVDLDRLPEAIDSFRRVTELSPDSHVAWNTLGDALRQAGRFNDSAACCNRAIELRPDFADAMHGVGTSLFELGRVDEAITFLRRALILRPDFPAAKAALLRALHYTDAASAGMIFEEHRNANAERGTRNAKQRMPAGKQPKPLTVRKRGKLRIGFVSPDFHRSVVGKFIEPIFAHLDKNLFETYAYSASAQRDEFTTHLTQQVDHWRDITALDTTAAEHLVRADKLDLLIDLAGHSQGNRLDIFAHKPAAMTATYLGYPGTTGLGAIDFRITDSLSDPAAADIFHTEKLLRLPQSSICYQPPLVAPEIVTRDPSATGVTFASLNPLPQISDAAIKTWSAILLATRNSRLILRSAAFNEPPTRQRMHAAFIEFGVEPDRVELIGSESSHISPLEIYNRIDIALDTFPYSGLITICDALWMGVPVITLAGKTTAGRGGASVLTNVDLKNLIATSTDDYERLSKELAGDANRLSELRSTLREKVRSSSLSNVDIFVRGFEDALLSVLRPTFKRKIVKPKRPPKPKAPPKAKSPRRRKAK